MSKNVAYEVASRINNRPSYISPQEIHIAQAALEQLAAANVTEQQVAYKARMEETASMYGMSSISQDKPFIYSEGLAIIPVQGMLINRFSYSWSFATGYNFIRGQLNAAMADDDVELIAYDVNSPGGECVGCSELYSETRAASLIKPSIAMMDAGGYSAAYLISCGATKMVCTPSGGTGSIGAMCSHMDMSGMMEKIGIVMTIVAEGAHKADLNPYQPLQSDVLDEVKAAISKRYDEFIACVVQARADKGLDEAAIRATESRCYRADDALALKLIDAVQTPAQAVSSFLAELGDEEIPLTDDGDPEMSNAATAVTAAAAQPAPVNVTPVVDTALVANEVAKALTADRQRASGIVNHAEAKERPKLAATLAAEGMTVEQAGVILAAAAKETAPVVDPNAAAAGGGGAGTQATAREGAFQAAMDASGGAGVQPAASTANPVDAKAAKVKSVADRFYGSHPRAARAS